MTETIVTGSQWRPIEGDDRSYWTVVSVFPGSDTKEACVGLTGPGPCRSYKSVPLTLFLQEWKQEE
jgi:hypothetical protein